MLPAPPSIKGASVALCCASDRAPGGQMQNDRCDGLVLLFSVSVLHAQPSITPKCDNGEQQGMIYGLMSRPTSLNPTFQN